MLFWLDLPWEAGQSTVLGVPLTVKKASGLIPMSTTYLYLPLEQDVKLLQTLNCKNDIQHLKVVFSVLFTPPT